MPDNSSTSSFNAWRIDEEAVSRFKAEHGDVACAPIVVVIAALDEETAIGAVIRAVPAEISGMAVRCIVVDDGSTDDTSSVARSAGALVYRLDRNLGQGRALRIGYRLASDLGAAVIVTLDADGQFDPSEMVRLAGPVASGDADFVNGSRRLGSSHTADRVRKGGLVFFGALVSFLSGTRITDPANGFRAFRPEVAERVPLLQAQYQTAELLMGAIALGYRVVEAPVTVLARSCGETKKGPNWRYGLRFGRVVLKTWWTFRRRRYGLPAPAGPMAATLTAEAPEVTFDGTPALGAVAPLGPVTTTRTAWASTGVANDRMSHGALDAPPPTEPFADDTVSHTPVEVSSCNSTDDVGPTGFHASPTDT